MPHSVGVGIDVSKDTLDTTILFETGEKFNSLFVNTKEGIREIQNFLQENSIQAKDQIVIESTGDFHLLVSHTLGKIFNVQIINPILSNRMIVKNIRKLKSDKSDSLILAQMALNQTFNEHLFNCNELKKRKIIAQIDNLEKHKAALVLSLKNSRKVFESFQFDFTSFSDIKNAIDSLTKAIKNLHLELNTLVQGHRYIQDLAAQKGISKDSANIIIAIIEDRKFKNKQSLVAYSGLDVSVKQSGKWRGKCRISKRGNGFLRKYLVQIAWGLIMHNEKFQKYAKQFKEKGRKYREIQVIVARKFLHMLYGSLKSNTTFSTEYLC